MPYQFHPACLAWPLLPEKDLQALADDIKAHGQQLPVVIWRGRVIDGRNRILACERAGVQPMMHDAAEDRFADDEEVWTYVCSLNAHRRHLTREQTRAVVDAHLKATPERSNRQVAAELGVAAQRAGGRRLHRRVRSPATSHVRSSPMPKKKRLDETHVYALCEHCGTRDVMSRRAWDNGFRPLCKACGAFLVPRETWQRPAQPKPRLRCKLCKAFLHSHNPGPYCTPCTNTMLTRGVHVLGAPRRIAQTDITA